MIAISITADEAAELRDRGTVWRTADEGDLRIVVRHRVDSDAIPGQPRISAYPGQALSAKLNRHGAVSAVVGADLLGVKPGEFDFLCPLATGRTYLDGCWRVDVAPGQFVSGPDGAMWVIAAVLLLPTGSQTWSWVVDVIPHHPHTEATP